MCTVVVRFSPGQAIPLLLAANRDERVDRAWDLPDEHWPGIVAGRDHAGGGTWLGLNRHGVVAAVLNRTGSLGPAPGKRSRGELPLTALAASTAQSAVQAIVSLDAAAWRGFNMVIADRTGVWFLRGLEAGRPEAFGLSDGVHMITAHDADDPASPRVARHLPRFRAAALDGAWETWRAILSDCSGPPGTEINVPHRGGFGTVCASILALPRQGAPSFLFAAQPRLDRRGPISSPPPASSWQRPPPAWISGSWPNPLRRAFPARTGGR